jgi:hypothetical protein
MIYDGYLETLSAEFDRHLSNIWSNYNFEKGDELETELCKVLRKVLPLRYGVCHGYIVTADNKLVGDDIIIFNRERFGTLRLLDQERFEKKEKIPLETVCAYIEVKHTLSINGVGGQSLQKAMTQVQAVQQLQRMPVPINQITANVTLPVANEVGQVSFSFARQPGWPDRQNPLYTAIWSRYIRPTDDAPVTEDISEIVNLLAKKNTKLDCIVAGRDVVGLPIYRDRSFRSPHFIDGQSVFSIHPTKELGFAVGVMLLLYALDRMMMEAMPFQSIIGDAFKNS